MRHPCGFLVLGVTVLIAVGCSGGANGGGASCTNGVRDGHELGIDCGGACPACLSPLPDDRRIEWNPGVEGGIPARAEICANVKEAPFNAAGDGIADDTAALRAAIDACGADGVVFLPEGIYRLTDEITISKSHITIRGAGPDRTRIQSEGAAHVFSLIGAGKDTKAIPLTADPQRGATRITLADASQVTIGSYLLVDQENDPSLVNSTGLGGTCIWCGVIRCSSDHGITSWACGGDGDACDGGAGTCEGGRRSLGHIVKVTSVEGNAVGVDPPLYWDFDPAFDPRALRYTGMTERVGLEDMFITKRDKAVEGGDIYIQNCASCWLKNLELADTPQYHVFAGNAFRNEFRDSYVHGSVCFNGNHGYGLTLQGHVTATLVENNVFDALASPVSFSAGGGGNVVAYNYFGRNLADYPSCGDYSHGVKHDVTQHGAHPIFNLYEGNVMGRVGSDAYWGSASHHVLYRNHIPGFWPQAKMYKSVVSLEGYARYFSVIGNVLGQPGVPYEYETSGGDVEHCWYKPYIYYLCYVDGDTCAASGCDPEVTATLLRHGNYDHSTGGVSWDPAIAEHDLVSSLYLDAAPAWWPYGLTWPPFGPDGGTAENRIPAQQRYEQLDREPVCGNGKIERRIERILIDDSDPACSFSGSWERVQGTVYDFKNNYAFDATAGSDADTAATFTLDLPVAGTYEVFLRWGQRYSSVPDAVPVSVVHAGGTFDATVDQTASAGTGGISLGSFAFSSGPSGGVVVRASDAGNTSVDGVYLLRTVAEQCDDGNAFGGDGCSSACTIE